MKVDCNALVLDLDGKAIVTDRKPVLGDDGKPIVLAGGVPLLDDGRPLKLGVAISAALMSDAPDEISTVDAKVKRFNLAVRIAKGGEVSLTAEDITTIKGAVCKRWPSLIVGRIVEALDPVAMLAGP